MRNVVRHFQAVPPELVPEALRSWTPLPPAPSRARRVDRERATPRPRNRCRVMIAVEPVRPTSTSNATGRNTARRAASVENADRVEVASTTTIALLLALVPPIGVALLWASPRYTPAGKIAVTLFAGFTLVVAAALAALAIVIA